MTRVGNIEYNWVLVVVTCSISWNENGNDWLMKIEISISYDRNAFDTLILSITGSSAFNGYEVC